jgi:chromosome segregation ATPase
MNRERKLLRAEKAKYKEELSRLRCYLNELSNRCAEHHTAHEHIAPDMTKAEHDIAFYECQVKDISTRLKALAPKANR